MSADPAPDEPPASKPRPASSGTSAPGPSFGGCVWPAGAAVVGGLVLTAVLGGVALGRFTAPAAPVGSVTVVRAGPSVITAVRDLARLESAEFHIERVIDLKDKQQKLLGMVESEDAILLVAAARVTAGVDLSALRDQDVRVDHDARRVEITLPAATIFSASLDNARTYVHTRDTGVLADRQESLETRARQEAESQIADAAKQAGILERAEANAVRTVEGLVRSLGFTDVTVRVAGGGDRPMPSAAP